MAGEMLLTPEEIDELKQTFIDLDDNGDGMLDNEELVVLFNSLNIVCADDDIKAFFALVDVDDDGTVDYDEFMTMVEHMMELAMAGHSYVDMFRMLDNEEKGYVSITELLQSLQNSEVGISLEDVKTILEYDCYVPGDKNKISFTSFRRIVMNELIPERELHAAEDGEFLSGEDDDDSVMREIRVQREAEGLEVVGKMKGETGDLVGVEMVGICEKIEVGHEKKGRKLEADIQDLTYLDIKEVDILTKSDGQVGNEIELEKQEISSEEINTFGVASIENVNS